MLTKKRTFKHLLLASVFAAALPAASIDYHMDYASDGSFVQTDWPRGSDAPTFSFSQFDSRLGSLTAVNLTWSGWIDSSYTLTNTSTTTPASIRTYQADISLRVLYPGSRLTDDAASLISISPHLVNISISDPDDPSYVMAPGATISNHLLITPGNTPSATKTKSITAADLLRSYVGADKITLPLYSTTAFTMTGTGMGNLVLTQTTAAKAHLDVSYIYTPATVPEPTTMAMVGGILVLAGFWGRNVQRRRR